MTDTRDHPTEIADSERPAARPLRGEGMRAMQGYAPEKVEPTDARIRDIPLSAIDTSNLNVYGPEDPRGDSYAQIAAGVHKLEDTVRPGVAAGMGREDFQALDQAQGLDPVTNGYTKTYDSFYGSDPVTLAKIGDRYEVDKGRHRLFVAKNEGLDSIPARVKEIDHPAAGSSA